MSDPDTVQLRLATPCFLAEECHATRRERDELLAANQRLVAECERLREALRPFAELAAPAELSRMLGPLPEGYDVSRQDDLTRHVPQGDCRRAAEALERAP